MTNDPLLLAASLKREATDLLQFLNLKEKIAPFGELRTVGSYDLDLMAWRDLDFHVILHPGVNVDDLYIYLFSDMIKMPSVMKLGYLRCLGDYKLHLPRGKFFGFRIRFPTPDVFWKADMWVLSLEDQIRTDAWIAQIKAGLDGETRALILTWKHRLMQDGRVPKGASNALYELVIREGLSDENAIQKRIKELGFDSK